VAPLSFSNATGNIFNRLGVIGGVLKNLRAYQTLQQGALTNTTTGVTGQFNSEPDLQAINGSTWIANVNAPEAVGQTMQQLAIQTLNRMIFESNPQLAQTWQQLNLTASIQELIRQMNVAGATVQQCNVATVNSAFTGTGNGVINSSVIRAIDGLTQQNAFAETITLTCNQDSYSGSATAGNEGFSVTGTGQESDVFAFDWPLGSNANIGVQAINGSSDNNNGNLLTNSDFQNWTVPNTPDQFTIAVGAAGTNVFRNQVVVYDGTSSLQLTGDGSGTLTSLTQLFNNGTTGTSGSLVTQAAYSVNLWLRRDGVAAASGVLTIDLIDGNGVVIQDAAGNNNTFSIDLTTLTTSFTAYKGTFRTPVILPAAQYLRLRLSTALTNGRSVYLARSSMGLYTRTYVGGPYVAVHSGSVPFVNGDYGTVIVSNDRGGAADEVSTFQTVCDRCWSMRTSGFLLPYSATPSISDALIAAS